MDNIAGSLGAAPIWKLLMEKFLQSSPVEEFKPPEGVIKLACIGIKEASTSAEYFVKGTEPKGCVSPEKLVIPSPTPKLTQPIQKNIPRGENNGGGDDDDDDKKDRKSKKD